MRKGGDALEKRAQRPSHFRVGAWVGVGVTALALTPIFARLADTHPIAISAHRMLIAAVIMLAFAGLRARRQFADIRRKDVPLLALAGFFLAMSFGFWITSLSETSVASSELALTTIPLFVAVGAHYFLGDKVGRLTVLAVAMSLFADAFITAGDWTGSWSARRIQGDIHALIGAAGFAGYLVVGRRARERIHSLSYDAVVFSIAGALLLAFAVASGAPLLGLPGETYFWIGMGAIIPQAVGYSIINWALGHWSSTNVALALAARPTIAIIFAFIALGETPRWATVVPGGALALFAVYLAVKSNDAPWDDEDASDHPR